MVLIQKIFLKISKCSISLKTRIVNEFVSEIFRPDTFEEKKTCDRTFKLNNNLTII